MQEEVTQKTIALSMKTGKLTAQALQAALKKYLQHRAKGPKLHHGKQSLKQLKAHGAALTNIEVTEANIGAFKPCAKKYGVDFTLRKDKTTQPPHYIVIFKAKDADNLEQAFREFTAKTLTKEQRPSIRKVLTAAKQKAAQQPKRAKEKNQAKGAGTMKPEWKKAAGAESTVSAIRVPVRQMRAGVPSGGGRGCFGKAAPPDERHLCRLCKPAAQPASV